MTSYPPTFFQALLEATAFLRSSRDDQSITKLKLCESMEKQLSLIISKLVTAPTGEFFRVFEQSESESGRSPARAAVAAEPPESSSSTASIDKQ